MNRILFYVHFNRSNRLSEHVIYQLAQMRNIFSKIVFISNSSLSSVDKKKISKFCDHLHMRDNIGYDFAAWRDGINLIGWSGLSNFDSVTLMNDTCFGPIYPMIDTYKIMEDISIDFWGVTDHRASRDGMPGSNGPIPPHIQSYMAVYNKKVVRSKIFKDFWNNIKNYQDVDKVISQYETQLTGLLCGAGFKYSVLFNTEKYSKIHKISIHNYSELLPLLLIRNRVPLLKIKSFKHTPLSLIKNELKNTYYPLGLIDKHLASNYIKPISLFGYYLKRVRDLLIRLLKMIYNKSDEKR